MYCFQLIGFYSWNLLRACRCVVDTGINALGWTFKQSTDYLLENSAVSKELAEDEVKRYITWPGQATAYKIGAKHFRKLRAKMEKELGDKFDIKEFHQHLFNCFGPLETLEECVRAASKMDSAKPKKRGKTDKGGKTEKGGKTGKGGKTAKEPTGPKKTKTPKKSKKKQKTSKKNKKPKNNEATKTTETPQ